MNSAASRSPLSAAGWLATAGASLLLVASVVVVAGNWASIDASVRFSGLVAALVAVYFVAEAARRRSPLTATALACLAATLTAPVGIAAAATLRQPWPVCLMVGGIACLIAAEVQSRRWCVPTLQAATVVSFGMAAVGSAALYSAPVALIGAGGACVALGVGAARRAVALGLAVGATPLLIGLADAGVGPGTVERLGASGSSPTWVATLSCTIAALVVGTVAHRRSNAPLGITAVAVFASGAISGVVDGDVSAVVRWTIPAIVLLLAELVGSTRTESIWRDLARKVAPALGFVIGLGALITPYWFIVARATGSAVQFDERGWIPLTLTALALMAASFGSARRAHDAGAATAALLAASGCLVAAFAVSGVALWAASVCALVGWAVLSIVTPWRTWDVTTAAIASWVLFAELVDGGPIALRIALITAAGVAVVVSLSTADRNDHGTRLIVAGLVVALSVAIVADTASLDIGLPTFLGLIVIGVGLRPRVSTVPLVVAGFVTYQLASDSTITWLDAIVTGLLACAFAVSSRQVDDTRTHIAAGVAVIATTLGAVCTGVDAGTGTLAAAMLAIALTGLSLVDRRLVAAQTAGLLAAVVAAIASLGADPAFTSLALTVCGAQFALAGLLWRGRIAAAPGAALTVAGVGSLWWTTGTNAWAIDAVAPYGASGTDLALSAAVCMLLGVGVGVRRTLPVSSWLAYGPGLAMAMTWLLSSQLEPGSDWATLGALAVGVTAVGVGGVHRLAAPLVIGTATLIGTIAVSAGPRLSTAPTWTWIAGGGVTLLVVAAIVERSERPLLPVGRRADHTTSLLEQFCEEFD